MNAKTEQAILKSIAAGHSFTEWKHRDAIIHETGRSYYTVARYLKDMWERGLLVHDEGESNGGRTYWEWWKLTDAGKANLQEGQT